GGLVVPVDSPRGEILDRQHHFRMLLDRFDRDRPVVLARDRQDNSAAPQRQQLPLKVHQRFAGGIVATQGDPVPSLVAHDTAPQRVVEVQDDNLTIAAANPPKSRLHVAGGRLEDVVPERRLGQVPPPRAEGLGTGSLYPFRGIERNDRGYGVQVFQQAQ